MSKEQGELVTAKCLMDKRQYTVIPEGFGAPPTRYQLTDDPNVVVTIKFPTIAVYKASRDMVAKMDAIRKKHRESAGDDDVKEIDYMALEDEIRPLQYEQMACVVQQKSVPEMESCYYPMVSRISEDFLKVLTESFETPS